MLLALPVYANEGQENIKKRNLRKKIFHLSNSVKTKTVNQVKSKAKLFKKGLVSLKDSTVNFLDDIEIEFGDDDDDWGWD